VGLLGCLAGLGRSVFDPSFLMPAGLLLMACGLLYVVLSVALWSEANVVVLTRRELVAFFYSPIAYMVLFGFLVIAWYLFYIFVYRQLWTEDAFAGLGGRPRPQIEPVVGSYIYGLFPIICAIFIVPVLTMRLLSEEQRTGTLEVLLTAPLGEAVVVLSKFLAAFLFYMVVWLPFGLYLVALRVGGQQPFDYLPVLSFFVAVAVSGAGFVSMGLFFSSLTRNQVGAAILTFVGMLALTFVVVMEGFWPEGSVMRSALEHVSYIDLWFNAINGRLAPRDVLFHFSAAVFWLFLTVKVLESRKWR
jgi:ABC-type transport system involved in multi-copper enzyme maturation permease subunit